MPEQKPDQRDAGRSGRGRHHSGDAERSIRPDHLSQQRDRRHQQRDAGWLNEREITVGHDAVDQPQRTAEVHAIVIAGEAEQIVGARQLIEPEDQREQCRGRDDDRHGRLGDARDGGPATEPG